MTDQFSLQELNPIFDKLARILATGLAPEHRERVLQGVLHRSGTSGRSDEKAIFEALRNEYRTSGTLDFVLVLTERIRGTRSYYQDVGKDLDQLEDLITSLQLRTSSAPRNKPYVFVLMPFNDAFKAVYEEAIRPMLRDEIACVVENADELNTTGQIIDDIFSRIRQADFLVADTTGKNPNVFYELGYAHALGKQVILIAQDAKDLPFDIKGLRHIIYQPDSLASLRTRLKKTAGEIIAAMNASTNGKGR